MDEMVKLRVTNRGDYRAGRAGIVLEAGETKDVVVLASDKLQIIAYENFKVEALELEEDDLITDEGPRAEQADPVAVDTAKAEAGEEGSPEEDEVDAALELEEESTVEDLRARATELDIPGRSTMNKAELATAIAAAEAGEEG